MKAGLGTNAELHLGPLGHFKPPTNATKKVFYTRDGAAFREDSVRPKKKKKITRP